MIAQHKKHIPHEMQAYHRQMFAHDISTMWNIFIRNYIKDSLKEKKQFRNLPPSSELLSNKKSYQT